MLHYWWITNKENRNLGPQVPIEGHHQTAATGRERGETGPNFCVEHRPPFSFRESGTVEKIQNNYQTCKLCVHYKNRERKALLVRHISVVCTEKSRTPFQLDKLPSVEDRGHADRVTVLANPCPWPMILTFNPPRAAIMPIHAQKIKVTMLEWKQKWTDVRTDTDDLIIRFSPSPSVIVQDGPKKWGHKLVAIPPSNLNRFTIFFARRFLLVIFQ